MSKIISGEIRSDTSRDVLLQDGRFGTERTLVTFIPHDLDAEIVQKDSIITQAQSDKAQLIAKKLQFSSQGAQATKP